MRNAEGGTANAATRALAAVAALALVTACTPDEGEPLTLPSPTASASTAPAPSPAVEEDDPFAVPAEIDEAYVERVLDELNRLDAELTRDILMRPVEPATELPPEDMARLTAIFGEPLATFNARAKVDLIRDQDQRDDLLAPEQYEQLYMDVESVLAVEPCLIVRVLRDYSGVDAILDDETSDIGFVLLVPSPEANVTGWRVSELIGSDAPPGSDDEAELRTYDASDILGAASGECAR